MSQKRIFWDSKLADYIEELISSFSNWYFDRKYSVSSWNVEPPKPSATLEEAYEEPKAKFAEQPEPKPQAKKKRAPRKKK